MFRRICSLAVKKVRFKLGPFSTLDNNALREATMGGLVKTGVKVPNILNPIRNMSGGQYQCAAVARTAALHSKLTIMDEPTAALGVQETAQVENIFRTLKEQGEPLILNFDQPQHASWISLACLSVSVLLSTLPTYRLTLCRTSDDEFAPECD